MFYELQERCKYCKFFFKKLNDRESCNNCLLKQKNIYLEIIKKDKRIPSLKEVKKIVLKNI